MGTAIRSMFRAVAVTAVVAVTAGVAVGSPADSQQAAADYRSMEELPTRAEDVSHIEETAIELAYELDAVAVSAEQHDITCPLHRLRVSWEEPVGYEVGTLVEPVGPAPGPETRSVNGVVVCEGSTYSFMGFAADHNGQWGWRVTAVPNFGYQHDEHAAPEPLELRYLDDLDPLFGSLLELGPIDDYAPYEPQRLCHSLPKPGAVALAKLLLDSYPGTQSYGISRPCDVGPRSEHKEGRAFDWGANAEDPAQAAMVEDLIQRLLATDEDGNEHALARRLGVMYVIWDGYIWSSFRHDEGWRPYRGPSAHTDHVHISLSWDGAMGRTSLWQVALDEIDLQDIGLRHLGTLPPVDGPVRDAFDSRRGVFQERTEEQREASEGDDERSADGSDDGAAALPGEDGGEDGTTDTVSDTVDDTTDSTTDTIDQTTDETTDTIDDTTDGATEDVTGTTDDTVDDTTDTVDDTVDGVTDGLDGAADGAVVGWPLDAL